MEDFECGPISCLTESGQYILKDVVLKFQAPRLVVINGPSGCGKSTLLRAVAGLNRAKTAKRRLDSRLYSEKELAEWRAHVTLLLQDAPCLDGSLLDNISFAFGFKNGSDRTFSQDRALQIINKVRLDHIPLDAHVNRLSGGERHRLGIVRGLVWAPPVLMADEPLSGLEPELADSCFDILKEYSRQQEAIVICVLHEERFALRADEWLRLEHGTLHRVNTI